MNVKLTFKKGFRKKYKERLKEAQDYVDNKCIECMAPSRRRRVCIAAR